MRKLIILLLVMLLCFISAYADGGIGVIKTLKGDVEIIRTGKSINASAGMNLSEGGDLVKSKDKSSIGIVFEDGTIFSLGANTEIIISKYLFQPKSNDYSMEIDMKKRESYI